MKSDTPLITVFTPAYNRRELLERCYNSLQNQTAYDFEWLIIDDGSTDDTKQYVDNWISQENRFKIKYRYKENGGLHTAYNAALEAIHTELCVCIDSDDWMPVHAIENMKSIWSAINDKNYVGFMGLDCYKNGTCIGDPFPDNIQEMFLYEKLIKYKIHGDKKMVYRTDILKRVAPMHGFEGEKNFNPSYMMYQADYYGKLFVVNEYFCIVEYQSDGMSNSIWKQYYNSPRSFAETRKLYMDFPGATVLFKFRQSIHYVSSYFLLDDKSIWNLILTIFLLQAMPFLRSRKRNIWQVKDSGFFLC